MRLKSIFAKFLVPTVLIISIFAVAILSVIGNLFTNAYEEEITHENIETCNFISQSVSDFMSRAYHITEELAYSNDILSMDTERQTPVVQGVAQRNDYFELVYIQDLNGDQTSRSSGTLGNRANRWWFTEMMNKKQPFVSKSYYSVSTNMACASIFIPLKSNNQMIGILATDIKLASLQSLVEQYSDIESGRIAFIIDGEGAVIAHPESVYYEELYNFKTRTRTISKKDSSGKILYDTSGNIITEELPIELSEEYANAINSVMSGESGNCTVSDNGKTYYASYSPVALDGNSDSWSVITLQDKHAALSMTDDVNATGILITIIDLIIAILIITAITRSITSPIKQCLNRLKLLSEGDLTTVLPDASGNDESAELVNTLNKTIKTLSIIISEITEFVTQIEHGDFTRTISADYSGEFNELAKALSSVTYTMRNTLIQIEHHSDILMNNINQLDLGAQMLSDGTSNQASAVEELSATLTDISQHISDNAGNSRQSDAKMDSIQEMVQCNSDNLNTLVDSMHTIKENSNEINGISKLIQDIANQTNLLSMNASIEAARAGLAGKGFAVLAGKIRILAEECTQAAQSTSDLIEKTHNSIHDGMEALENTVASMQSVSEQTETASLYIRNITKASNEQAEAINQIAAAVNQISEVTQSNSASAVQSAAASNTMKDQINTLNELLRHYKC
ncbi:MAG: methyl-accepting chemotaxis protein [Lachnospira sp.]|nr:methyl-accepting chemotaxis protein [Lachnospira sp.]